MSLIEVKDLNFSYNEKKKALEGVNFSIEKGSYTCVIGHNGSGKSTLAKLMAGLLELKEGSIIIEGMELNPENLYQIRNKLGIVFQNPDNQFIGSTVEDDIAFGLENHQVESGKMQQIIQEYAAKAGVEELLKNEPQNLSGGQKQRVAIAGVLAMHPDIIIFDEATSMLDPKGKRDIKKLMSDLHQEKELTIISITHDIEEVLQASDVLVLSQGKVFMHDTPAEVFRHVDELKKINLDIPFVSQIKQGFKEKHIRLKSDDLEGMVEELWQSRSNR